MKPLSQEAIKRLALSHGGKLEIDGSRINSARLQVVTKGSTSKSADMPNNPEPVPTKTIETSKPDPALREAMTAIGDYTAAQFLINDSNVELMKTVKELLQKVATPVDQEKRPTQWVFKVKRDAHGLMETITATAKFKE